MVRDFESLNPRNVLEIFFAITKLSTPFLPHGARPNVSVHSRDLYLIKQYNFTTYKTLEGSLHVLNSVNLIKAILGVWKATKEIYGCTKIDM